MLSSDLQRIKHICDYCIEKHVAVGKAITFVRQYEMTPALVRRGFACHTLDANQM